MAKRKPTPPKIAHDVQPEVAEWWKAITKDLAKGKAAHLLLAMMLKACQNWDDVQRIYWEVQKAIEKGHIDALLNRANLLRRSAEPTDGEFPLVDWSELEGDESQGQGRKRRHQG